MDFLWRRRAARIVASWKPHRLLDVATGSGDLAHAIGTKCPDLEVIGVDFCLPMLEQARGQGLALLAQADGLHLPFCDGVFDAVTVAFGLRNMASWEKGLQEMRRVTRKGGHLLILDFSMPGPLLAPLYRLYLHHVLPVVAGMLSGNREAYKYLGESIEEFPRGEAMHTLLRQSGWEPEIEEPMSGGIVAIHTAVNR